MEILETMFQRQKIFQAELHGCAVVLSESSRNSIKTFIGTNQPEGKTLTVFSKGLLSFRQKDYLSIRKLAHVLKKKTDQDK